MFCTKCGYNAGDAKFCPKCGNPLAVQATPVQEPVVEQPQAAPVQEPVVEQPQAAPVQKPVVEQPQAAPVQEPVVEQPQAAPVQEPVAEQPQATSVQQPVMGQQVPPVQPQQYTQQQFQPQFNGMPFGGQPGAPVQEPKKKKKWPKVVGIVAAIVIVLCAAGYFAYPYISEMISPKKQAVTALKNAGDNFETLVSDSMDSLSTTSVSTKEQVKGSFKLGSATVDGMNYMSYLKADTINYDLQVDTSTQTVSGTLGLSSGSAANIINLQFYTDTNYVYFKIPELFSESFRVSASDLGLSTYGSASISSSLGDLSDVSSMLGSMGSMDLSSLSQYSDVIDAVMKDVMTGFDKMVDQCGYKKTGSSTYQSENGDIKVTTFDVTLTKDALIQGINTAIDALYADSTVSPYLSFLSLAGGSKETIKSSVQAGLSTMKDVPFTIYVNKDDQIVKAILNVSTFSATETGDISFEFIGKDKPTDYVIVQANIDDVSIKYALKTENDSVSVACDIIPDQKENSGEFISIAYEMAASGTTVSLKNMSVKGKVEDNTFDVSLSGDIATSSFGVMSLSSSSFKGYINPSSMSTTQQTKLSEELLKNLPVIKKVISDSLYNQMFGILGV